MIVCRDNPVAVISLSRNTASPFSHNYRFLVRCTRSPRLRKVCTMALTRRAIKRAGPSKKVWCSRLGSTKSRRFQLLTHSNLEFTRNSLLRESANFWPQFLFWGNGKKWVFQGWKQDIKFRAVNEQDLLALVVRVSFWLMNIKVYARKLASLVSS